jgi:hypothetical protein
MPTQPGAEPSFSPRQRWTIILNVTLTSLCVLAVVVMVNYLGRDYFTRLYWGAQAKTALSPFTVNFLRSLTNQVNVTLFYNKKDPLYRTIANLLDEYHLANPRITIQAVDYVREPSLAQTVRAEYSLTNGAKDVIMFDCPAMGQRLSFDGNELTRGVAEFVPVEAEPESVRAPIRLELLRRPTEFLGERVFTSGILAVTNPRKLNAYFLEDHRGEQEIQDGTDFGCRTFKSILEQNSIHADSLSLLGTNAVPTNCNLLIIAGPKEPFWDLELQKIDQYLNQGGRLLALFKFDPLRFDRQSGRVPTCGLEGLLEKWGVEVGNSVILDFDNSESGKGYDILVSGFSQTHPVVNPLISTGLEMIQPRKVGRLRTRVQTADAPHVEELAFTGTGSVTTAELHRQQSYPVMVAVENTIRGVSTERGSTRMLVVGDSLFLANRFISQPANRAFAGYAANWLLDRLQLLQGIGPKPIGQYQIVMTKIQTQATRWLLLAGLPGTVLFLGALVWLRRRR